MPLKLRERTIVIPYSDGQPGKIYNHPLQNPANMRHFLTMRQLYYPTTETMLVLHLKDGEVVVEKYRDKNLVAQYHTDRRELRGLPTLIRQKYIAKKLDRIEQWTGQCMEEI